MGRITGGECNFGSIFGQLYSDGFADAGAAAGDKRNFVCQH